MAVTKYRWDDLTDNIHQETDEHGTIDVQYTQKPDLYGHVLSQRRGTTKSFYHFDGQGSTRKLTNVNQVTLNSYTYSAYGSKVAESGAVVNPFQWTGEMGYYNDLESGNIYIRHRSYSNAVSRWLTKDPLSHIADVNSYRYVGNSPPNNFDASGLAPWFMKFLGIDFENRLSPDHLFEFEFTIAIADIHVDGLPDPIQSWFLNYITIHKLDYDCTWKRLDRVKRDVWVGTITDEAWIIDKDTHTWIATGDLPACGVVMYTQKLMFFNMHPNELPVVSNENVTLEEAQRTIDMGRDPTGYFDEFYYFFKSHSEECVCIPCWLPVGEIECASWPSVDKWTCENDPPFIGEKLSVPPFYF